MEHRPASSRRNLPLQSSGEDIDVAVEHNGSGNEPGNESAPEIRNVRPSGWALARETLSDRKFSKQNFQKAFIMWLLLPFQRTMVRTMKSSTENLLSKSDVAHKLRCRIAAARDNLRGVPSGLAAAPSFHALPVVESVSRITLFPNSTFHARHSRPQVSPEKVEQMEEILLFEGFRVPPGDISIRFDIFLDFPTADSMSWFHEKERLLATFNGFVVMDISDPLSENTISVELGEKLKEACLAHRRDILVTFLLQMESMNERPVEIGSIRITDKQSLGHFVEERRRRFIQLKSVRIVSFSNSTSGSGDLNITLL